MALRSRRRRMEAWDAALGTGDGLPPLPPGFIFLVDRDGAFLTDADGAFLVEPV